MTGNFGKYKILRKSYDLEDWTPKFYCLFHLYYFYNIAMTETSWRYNKWV